MSRYDTTVDPENLSSSHGLMVDLVGRDKRVLDIGCASGYLGRVLIDRGCSVSGVEYDEDDAEQAQKVLERVLVADLEVADLVQEFGSGGFDVVVLGDVLEHLKDPVRVLRQVDQLLGADGYAVISLPNVAHGDVRLSLLRGRFVYRPVGLLDSTHLRFFTRTSVHEMLEEAGFVAVDFRRTTTPLFTTELEVRREDYPDDVVAGVDSDPESHTYQFVLSAVPHRGSPSVRRMHELALQLEDERARAGEVERTSARLATDLDAVRLELGESAGRAEAATLRAAAAEQESAALRTALETSFSRRVYRKILRMARS